MKNLYSLLLLALLPDATACPDLVATAGDGNETTNYVDPGINSSTHSANVMGAADDAYLAGYMWSGNH